MQAFTPPSKKATVAKPPSAQPAQTFTAAPAAKPQGQPGATMTAAPAMPPMRAPATPPRAMPQQFAGQPGIYRPNAAANAAQAPQGQFAVPFNMNVQQSRLRRAMERIAPAAPMQVIQPGMQTTTQAVTSEEGNATPYTDEQGRVWEKDADGWLRTRWQEDESELTPETIAKQSTAPEEDAFVSTEERERLLQKIQDALPEQEREILAQIARAALGANMSDALRGGYGGVSEAEQAQLFGAGQSAIAQARAANLEQQRALTQDEAAAESEQSALEWDMFNSFGENQARAYTLSKQNQTLEQQIADALEAGDTEKADALAKQWNKNTQELEGLKNSSGAVTETADAPPEPEPEEEPVSSWDDPDSAERMEQRAYEEIAGALRDYELDFDDVGGTDLMVWLFGFANDALTYEDADGIAIAARLLGVEPTAQAVRLAMAGVTDPAQLKGIVRPNIKRFWQELIEKYGTATERRAYRRGRRVTDYER